MADLTKVTEVAKNLAWLFIVILAEKSKVLIINLQCLYLELVTFDIFIMVNAYVIKGLLFCYKINHWMKAIILAENVTISLMKMT